MSFSAENHARAVQQLIASDEAAAAAKTVTDAQAIADAKAKIETAREAFSAAIEAAEPDSADRQDFLEEGCTCPTSCAPCGWCESVPEEVFEAREALSNAEDDLRAAERVARPISTALRIQYVAEPTVRCEGTRVNIFAYFFDMAVRSSSCKEQASWRLDRGQHGLQHLCDSCNRDMGSDWPKKREPIVRGDGGDERRLRDAKSSGWERFTCAERIKAKALTIAKGFAELADGVDPGEAKRDAHAFEAELTRRAGRLLRGE